MNSNMEPSCWILGNVSADCLTTASWWSFPWRFNLLVLRRVPLLTDALLITTSLKVQPVSSSSQTQGPAMVNPKIISSTGSSHQVVKVIVACNHYLECNCYILVGLQQTDLVSILARFQELVLFFLWVEEPLVAMVWELEPGDRAEGPGKIW